MKNIPFAEPINVLHETKDFIVIFGKKSINGCQKIETIFKPSGEIMNDTYAFMFPYEVESCERFQKAFDKSRKIELNV